MVWINRKYFKKLIKLFKSINELPEGYKNLILSGYLSILMIFSGRLILHWVHENEAIIISVIIMLVGIIVWLLSVLFLTINLRKIKNQSKLNPLYTTIRSHVFKITNTVIILNFCLIIINKFFSTHL
jgi:hypothetical protein